MHSLTPTFEDLNDDLGVAPFQMELPHHTSLTKWLQSNVVITNSRTQENKRPS